MKRPWLTCLIGLGLCVAGVAVAVWGTGNSTDGGRGGALAVALSFWILFQNHDSAKTTYDNAADIPDKTLRTHNALGALIDAANKQRAPLTVTSVTGTLFWGFGDLIARAFGAN